MLTEGQQPYTPTRAQWLSVALNSTNIISNPVSHKGLSVVFASDSKRDTIKIIINHPKELSQVVETLIAHQKSRVLAAAKLHGWDSWLKIEVHVEVAE